MSRGNWEWVRKWSWHVKRKSESWNLWSKEGRFFSIIKKGLEYCLEWEFLGKGSCFRVFLLYIIYSALRDSNCMKIPFVYAIFCKVSRFSPRNCLMGMCIPSGDTSALTQFWVLCHVLPGDETKLLGDARCLPLVCCVSVNFMICWTSNCFLMFVRLHNAMISLLFGVLAILIGTWTWRVRIKTNKFFWILDLGEIKMWLEVFVA